MTPEKWAKLGGLSTKTSGFTLAQAIACAVEFDDQHCGIYAGDEDSYAVFADVFDPIIEEYHGLPAGFKHTSDMDAEKVNGNIDAAAPVHRYLLFLKKISNRARGKSLKESWGTTFLPD